MTTKQLSRKFTVEIETVEVELQFRRPDQAELFQIDKQYRIIYSAGIREAVMTEVEARRHFSAQGTWTDQHDQDIRSIAAQIAQLEVVLRASDARDPDSLTLASNINILRAKMMEKIGDKQELFSNTAEGLANEQKMHKFIELCCVKAEDGEPFFRSADQYRGLVSTDVDAMSEIHKEGYFFEYRLPEDVAKDWAEIEFAERIAEVAKEAADDARKKQAAKKKASKKTTKKTKKKNAKKKKITRRTKKTATAK